METGTADLDSDNLPALRTVLASCLGLVTVEVSSSTVRLVHFSLQEHLSHDPTLFHSPHSEIAEVCLTYLNFGSIRCLSPTLVEAPATAPLLEYASVYWGRHTGRGVTENIKRLALRLLDRFDEHISARLLLLGGPDSYAYPYYHPEKGPTGFIGLHGVAFLGIVEVAAAVLDMKEWNINAADCGGNTALSWAAQRGNDGVVRMLLDREDANPSLAETYYGMAPLRGAARNGHEGVVKMLLERRDVDPDQADSPFGWTPLWCAAESGHEGVVRMLLERKDVNPNHAAFHLTPLTLMAKEGDVGVVKMLLERTDIDPNQADAGSGRTPLSWAVKNGHEGIVKMLLERKDVNPNQANTQGQTPLWLAAAMGHAEVVRLLLERNDVNPDQADTFFGWTPLWLAAATGPAEVVKMLLERKDVDPDQADANHDRTPLGWAAEKGHVGVVRMLLERKDVDPDQADANHGRTPLWWATAKGDEVVVKMLLERKDVNPNEADANHGRTPLGWAAEAGHERMVKIFLKYEIVNPNQADTEYGRTPLLWAARNGHERVVKILLEVLLKRKNYCTAALDNQNQTPLTLALSNGHDGVVKTILEWENASSNTADRCSYTSLPPHAVHRSECWIGKQLRGDDPNTAISDLNDPPVPLSAESHSREVVLDFQDSVSKSTDSDLSPIRSHRLPLPPSNGPNSQSPLGKTDIHPNAAKQILSFAANRYFIISSFICLFAFLLYILPSSSLDIFLFRKG